MNNVQNQTIKSPASDIKRSLLRAAFPLVERITNHIPGSKKLAWAVYSLMTARSERWMNVRGTPLLVNIHDKGIGTLLFLQNRYASARVAEIQKVVKEGDVVIDIGANIGYFTVLLANLVGPRGRVYAFEPDPRNFALLLRTIERNGYTQVVAEQKAVSNKAGEFLFYQTIGWASNTLIPGNHVSAVNVQVVTLDDFLCDEHQVHFVKMDTDGSEPLAIQGMTQLIRRSPNLRVLAEYQPGNLKRYLNNPLEFLTTAEECGLRLATILDSDSGRLPSLDLASLKQLADDVNLDLLFTTK